MVSVPIQALTVREMLFDRRGRAGARATASAGEPVSAVETDRVDAPAEPPPGTRARRPRASSSAADGRAVFTPVKIGIAGEQYFEVLSGLTAGDQVITGPFASVRELADGQERPAAAANDAPPSRAAVGRTRTAMNQILESICIALQAIWANKLRSFMTVLGNIVAVTSIVTVVTLIQGMNAMVSDAIVSDVGADSFTDPAPAARSAARTTRSALATTRSSRWTRPTAIRALQPAHRGGDGAGPAGRPRSSYRDQRARERPGPGRDQRLRPVLDLQRRARPADEPHRGGAQPAGGDPRLGRGRPAVRRRSTRSTR